MGYKQKTDTPLAHCWAGVMHTKPWNKMRERTAAAAGRGTGNDISLSKAEEKRESPLAKKTKAKGGGTTKACLPKAKIASMSAAEKKKVINAKKSAGSKGKRVRSSQSNVSGTSANSLEDWVKQDWRQVANPSKKCGEK
jgi:hypothetical protein